MSTLTYEKELANLGQSAKVNALHSKIISDL